MQGYLTRAQFQTERIFLNKKTIFLYFLGLCFLSMAWYYQFHNSMEYQRYVAVNIGAHLTELKSLLEKKEPAPEKFQKTIQREFQGLGIELFGPQIDSLSSRMPPEEALKHLAEMNAVVIDVLKRDKIEDYFFYGKKWAVVKMLLAPLCGGVTPAEESKDMVLSELRDLLDIERRLANRNDQDTELLWNLLKSGGDYHKSCGAFLEKAPMPTLSRLMHGMDQLKN